MTYHGASGRTRDLSTRCCRATCLIVILTFLTPYLAKADQFLSTGEVAAITAGSGGVFWLGQQIIHGDNTRTPLLKGPLPLEASIQRFFGGRYEQGKRNFLDDSKGSVLTPLTTGSMLMAANLAWPESDRGKATLQDMFLFISGLAATKGVTDMAKGLTNRPRPYMTLVPNDKGERRGLPFDRSSFFSGHTSSTFFSAAYLNLRLRSIMRAEMTRDEYRRWRWAPPTVLFSWSSFVGLSRVHAYRHYLSDVLIGALAGYLIAELFSSFGENSSISDSDPHPVLFRLRIPL